MAGELTNWTPGQPNTTFPSKINSYKSILHFVDNDAMTSSLKSVVDGLGNATGIKISTSQISIDNPILFSSLTASKLVYINGSGVLTTIADGTAGQVLQTNGAGVYSFATVSGGGGITINTSAITGGTSGRLLYDNAGTVGELDTATYPSLTELSYVKGVTSAIQTQLNSKLGALTINSTSITSGTAGRILFENASNQISEAAGLTYSSGLFTVLGTTQQAKYAYDASNHAGFTTSSTGDLTITLTGTSPRFITNKDATINTIRIGLGLFQASTDTGIGVDTLKSTIAGGGSNTALGHTALQALTSGANNTMIGRQAGYNITTGVNMVGVGFGALANTTAATGNVAVGLDACKASTGQYNVGVGFQVLLAPTGGNNTALGTLALTANLAGTGNTGLGREALFNVTGGINNTAIGYKAGSGITTGSSNTIIGANVTGLSSSLAANIIIADGTGQIRYESTAQGLFKFRYDASNYVAFTVGSTGSLTIALTGTNPRTTFSQGVTMGGTLRKMGYTVATLPSGVVGDTAYVTDATAPTYLGALVGGGAVTCPVFYDGTAWVSA